MAKYGASAQAIRFFQQVAASLPQSRETPAFPPLLVPGLTHLFPQGIERGSITEVHGPRSSGRTGIAYRILSAATMRGEICALVDLYGAFAPGWAAQCGVILDRLIWVRANGNMADALRAADLILHAGGFGLVVLDLCEATARMWNGIPLSYWYRFRAAVEHTPTILTVVAARSQVRSAARSVELGRARFTWSGRKPARLLCGLESSAVVKTARGLSDSVAICSEF